jgi:peptidoglycan/LPS O-acetylase OafA/YrhL
LLASLFFTALIIILVGPLTDHQRFARQGLATLLLVGNIGAYKYAGDYFNPNPNPLIHTWSLSVEEQIYLTLPIIFISVFYFVKKNKKNTSLIMVIFTILLSLLLFLFPTILQSFYSNIGIKFPSQIYFYSPINRIWEFAIGGLCYLLKECLRRNMKKDLKKTNLMLVIGLLITIFGPFHVDSKVATLIVTLITCGILIFESLRAIPPLYIRKLEWLGDRSYSIYLIHMPLLYIFLYSPILATSNSHKKMIIVLVGVTSSVLFGSLSYSKIENRFRDHWSMHAKNPKRVANLWVLMMLMMFAIFFGLNSLAPLELSAAGLPPRTSSSSNLNWDSKCEFFSPNLNLVHKPCRYGTSRSGKSILLIGDSHAATDARAVVKIAKRYDLVAYIFTYSRCGFVLNTVDLKSQYSYPGLTPDCIKYNHLVLDFVKKSNPTVIIWAHRSSSIMVSPNNLKSRFEYNKILEKNLSILVGINQNLINIGSEPELDPVLSLSQILFNHKKRFSQVPLEDDHFWEKANPSHYFLSSMNIFCPKNVCMNKIGKVWLFRDTDHLTDAGADMLFLHVNILVKSILNHNI